MSELKKALSDLFDAYFLKTSIMQVNENKPIQNKYILFEHLQEAIDKSLVTHIIKLGEPVTVLKGFVDLPFAENIDIDSHKKIPCVILVGDSGRLYFYALRVLLPDLEM